MKAALSVGDMDKMFHKRQMKIVIKSINSTNGISGMLRKKKKAANNAQSKTYKLLHGYQMTCLSKEIRKTKGLSYLKKLMKKNRTKTAALELKNAILGSGTRNVQTQNENIFQGDSFTQGVTTGDQFKPVKKDYVGWDFIFGYGLGLRLRASEPSWVPQGGPASTTFRILLASRTLKVS